MNIINLQNNCSDFQCSAFFFHTQKTSGHQFTIPMPGHTEDCSMDQTVEDVERISQLIEKHDVIFLMLDSRESRWLPTVIAAAKKKVNVFHLSFLELLHFSLETHPLLFCICNEWRVDNSAALGPHWASLGPFCILLR